MTALLDIKGLSAGYGPVVILRDISLGVEPGSITALVGPNGAGKTTLMKTILGLIRANSGAIVYDGADISKNPSHSRVDGGIALVPEGRMVFAALTVEQNLRLGAVVPRAHGGALERLEEIYRQFPRLKERRRQLAGSMSGGEQQMLAIGRSLMAKPRLILLDEPTLGLAPIMVKKVFEIISQLRADGYTVLLSEQNSKLALETADHGYIIENGIVTLSGPARELVDDPDVKRRYFGM
ncbi:MAG TPA: ABC transporter ATP-binding protein [Mesorhizobium sp.]|jgi:branched-chain amino acid transport system ATP-binding protein|uniref:ABC transporter ATP-binding protein n=1 Tax=Mesorhizobium sp. TaxID=1871066 RepID=UPI002DDC9E58|nr:ABC transporter ATP-binding protein [Mesorhizobium sp.]HEV2505358.1 ABC transporter ATP-binding protein [Mesorhizobium sp.]